MKVNKYIDELLDGVITVSDSEIQALADLSQKTDAYIREYYDSGKYFMTIKFHEKDEEEILLASDNKNDYKEMSKNFLRKFVKFGGNIDLEDIFTRDM